MAHDKLKEGIEGFSKALEKLEVMLAKRLSEIEQPAAAGARGVGAARRPDRPRRRA